jgi:rod shape determining protein RodA
VERKSNILANIDWITVGLYLFFIILGWLNIYAAVYDENHTSILDFSMRYGKQFFWIIAAIILAFACIIIDGRFYNYFAYILYAILIIILISLLFIGKEIHGSKSWFVIGNIQIQPSEFAKVVTALALAKYLSTYNLKINSFKTYFITALLIFIPIALILLQHDTGSALVFFSFVLAIYRFGFSPLIIIIPAILIVLFFLALLINNIFIIVSLIVISFIVFYYFKRNIKLTLLSFAFLALLTSLFLFINNFFSLNYSNYLIIFTALIVSSIFYLIYIYIKKIRYAALILLFLNISTLFTFSINYVFYHVLEKHQQQRINILLGIESDPLDKGYNVNQSKIAIGSGGFSGKGFLQGTQTKYNFVPEQSTDFIFCTIGEEWGFIGSSLVIILFGLFLLRIINLAERQRSQFSRIYGYCIVVIFFFHIAVNVGMAVGLLPVIGIPLPFFSYGGSSLWAFTIMLFIFLRLDASRLELV